MTTPSTGAGPLGGDASGWRGASFGRTGGGALDSLDGAALRGMFGAGLAWLEQEAEAVNALNVFPVPDGDTGTNMLLTMRFALEEAAHATSADAGETAAAIVKGALMGARGNGGVILSQVWRGFAQSVKGKARITAADLPDAFKLGSEAAYKAVGRPVEGTILTVVRKVAEALSSPMATMVGLPAAFLLASDTAKEWVKRTPDLMPLLKENGVVDSGGQGFSIILDGMSHFVHGDAALPAKSAVEAPSRPLQNTGHQAALLDGQRYGFCTEFFIEHARVEVDAIRLDLQAKAGSVLVAGDIDLVKVHLHTVDPDSILVYAGTLGASIAGVKIEDMDAQNEVWKAKRKAAVKGRTGVVAVVSGKGLEDLFHSLGVAEVVVGGQTMNPSAQDILEAIQRTEAREVIVLPNNKNILLAARQAQEMAQGKNVRILPTHDVPQGVSAMIAFNYEMAGEENHAAMQEALDSVRTGEVTRAVRDSRIASSEHNGSFQVRNGDFIGLASDRIVATGAELGGVVADLLERLRAADGAAITLYYGGGLTQAEAEATRGAAQTRYPDAEVSIFAGGQPHYFFLISVE